MPRFSNYLHSMYVWTIILLVFLAVVASFARSAFPINLLIAVITATALDILIKKVWLKKTGMPFSAIISGIIIGSIAPFNAPVSVVVLASAVVILSKFLIRFNDHVFNPAALGLLVSLSLFGLGDEWWAAGASVNILGAALTLTPLLILASYKAGKLGVSLPFLLATAILYHAMGIATISLSGANIIRFLDSLPYYFGFIMVSEPRTSPYIRKEQIAFGISVAVISVLLTIYSIKYALFIALLLGNLAYALYRNRKK